MPADIESLLHQICLIVGTLVMAVSSTIAICREEPSPYSSCLKGFQAPVQPFYHKFRTHWIAVLGLLLAVIGFVGSLWRSKRLLAMYEVIAPFALLPFVYTMVRFVADALSKVHELLDPLAVSLLVEL
ncbi:hypothetical protein MTO96_039123 [Rhipicephalus appendiculatus]